MMVNPPVFKVFFSGWSFSIILYFNFFCFFFFCFFSWLPLSKNVFFVQSTRIGLLRVETSEILDNGLTGLDSSKNSRNRNWLFRSIFFIEEVALTYVISGETKKKCLASKQYKEKVNKKYIHQSSRDFVQGEILWTQPHANGKKFYHEGCWKMNRITLTLFFFHFIYIVSQYRLLYI